MATIAKRSGIQRVLSGPSARVAPARKGSLEAKILDDRAETEIKYGKYTRLSSHPTLTELMSTGRQKMISSPKRVKAKGKESTLAGWNAE